MASGYEPACDVTGIGDEQSSVTVKKSPRVQTFPLCISLWSETRTKKWNGLVLSLIGFDFGGTQLPADRTLPGAPQSLYHLRVQTNDSFTHNWGCRQAARWERPTWKHGEAKSAIGSASHVSNGMSKLEFTTTVAYWKALLLWHVKSFSLSVFDLNMKY